MKKKVESGGLNAKIKPKEKLTDQEGRDQL